MGSLVGKSYQCHQRAGTAAAKPPWRPAEWEMRIGRARTLPWWSVWMRDGALHGVERSNLFCTAPHVPAFLSGFVVVFVVFTLYLEPAMEPTSSNRILAVHHCDVCKEKLGLNPSTLALYRPTSLNRKHVVTHMQRTGSISCPRYWVRILMAKVLSWIYLHYGVSFEFIYTLYVQAQNVYMLTQWKKITHGRTGLSRVLNPVTEQLHIPALRSG